MDLKTPRLLLRKPVPADLEDFLEYFTEPSVANFLGGFPPSDRNGASIIFKGNMLSEYSWVVELTENGRTKVIGDVHFGNIVCGYLAHVGYVFNKNYRGRGYATEALSAVVDYGFSELGFGRIRAITQICNMPSQRLLERCGFTKEALIYDGDFNGKIDDLFYYSKSKY
ncbi:acetyltransferase [Clostridia bacterium]|nr:acetyltransferase [Clostridia bacterium]